MKQVKYFIYGMGSLIDITSYTIKFKKNLKKTYIKSDTKALENDWKIVGDDMRSGLNGYKKSWVKR